jgi:hypothetical protein
MALEEYFATGPPFERPVFDAVMAHLVALGPLHVEPVSVGVFVKGSGSWVELRPLTRWVAMSFPLRRVVDHPRIARKPVVAGERVYHWVNLRGPGDVDELVRDWLTESYQSTQ